MGKPAGMRYTGRMNLRTFTLALLAVLPLAATAGTQETQTWINGRSVSIRTEESPAAPAKCQQAVEQQLAREGWYNEIQRVTAADSAYLIFSQRAAEPCQARNVKITLWRAVVRNATTVVEAREYTLKAAEVNAFLDTELRPLAAQFEAGATRQS